MFSITKVFIAAMAVGFSALSVSAQGDSQCARGCLINAYFNNWTGCGYTDYACLCQSQDFITNSAICAQSQCSYDEQVALYNYATSTCSAAGVNADVPTPWGH